MTAPDTQPVVYEVECTLDPAGVADFEAWLPGHVRQVLACPGFTGAEIIVYVPYYVFRSMRVVYGESMARTAVKFVAISQLCFVLLALTISVRIVYSMLSLWPRHGS